MANPNKRKGDAAERLTVQWLRDKGYIHAERAYGAGRNDDVGDIDGIPGVCIEVKDHGKHTLAEFIAELEVEMKNSHADTGVVIIKRRGTTDVDQWYALTKCSIWVDLLRETER